MEKEQILNKASEMFYSLGFKTLTMDDVANNLAMSKKTLYELFGSKEKLIELVLIKSFEDVQEYFVKIQEKDLDAVEELLILKQYVDDKFTSVQRQTCMYQLQRYYAKLYKKIFLSQHQKIISRLESNFSKGKKQGLYRQEIEPQLYAELFLEIQNLLKSNQSFSKDLKKQLQMLDIQSEVFVRGILSQEGLNKYKQLIK